MTRSFLLIDILPLRAFSDHTRTSCFEKHVFNF